MAAGFWRRLLNMAYQGPEEAELEEEEAGALKEKGHIRRHYLLSGRVQSVGLRYTAVHIAEELGLSGWVLNREDGMVELELQGTEETMELFMTRLDGHGRISISDVEMEECCLQAESGFWVRS